MTLEEQHPAHLRTSLFKLADSNLDCVYSLLFFVELEGYFVLKSLMLQNVVFFLSFINFSH